MRVRHIVVALALLMLVAGVLPLHPAGAVRVRAASGLTSHSPIIIYGDSNFTAANGVVSGTGTQSDPYVIAGWKILNWGFAQPYTVGIGVVNTDKYFIVRDVYLDPGTRDPEPGGPDAVILDLVSHGTVQNATVNGSWRGISAAWSNDISFLGNSINNTIIDMIVWEVTNGTVSGNALGSAATDVLIENCNGTRFVANSLIGGNVGLNVTISNDTTVYHNNFLGNTDPAQLWQPSLNVTWDNGYPSGGNYWSNYTGVDHCSGPQQTNCSGPDGVGDTPYTFATGGVDHYPLMEPYPHAAPPPQTPSPFAAAGWTLYLGIAGIVVVAAVVVVVIVMRRRKTGKGPQLPIGPSPPQGT